jgi:hypothetical protein
LRAGSDLTPMIKIIKLFKYELIKILIFLFLFGCSLAFVLSAQGDYYNKNDFRENYHGKPNNTEKLQNQNKAEN